LAEEYALRLDSEFFLKARVAAHQRILSLSNSVRLKKCCSKVVQGPNPDFVDDGIPCLNGKNIYFGTADADEPNFVTEREFDRLKGHALQAGDIVITLKHATKIGRAWIIEDSERRIFTRNVGLLRLNSDSEVRAVPLLLTLWTNGYQTVLDRIATGGTTGQITLATTPLKELPIPRFSDRFQSRLEMLFKTSQTQRRDAEGHMRGADQLLLDALQLPGWQPPEPLTYTRRASEAFIAGRLDAEHFQPKYKALLKHIQRHASRCRRVDEFAAHCDRGEQPEYADDGTLAVVNSRHILENGLDYDSFESTDSRFWNDPDFKAARIHKHDILTYTTGAKVGRTAAYLSDERALASNHVNLLRLREENPVYVAVAMNSMIGRWQTRMLATGSAQVELYPADIRRFLIPFVDAKTEAAIVSAVERAHTARREARSLLDCAKRAVEIAIEETEADAMNYLKSGR